MRYLWLILVVLIGFLIGFALGVHPVNPHKVHIQPVKVEPVKEQPRKNDDNDALSDYVNPANPIGLFSSNWMPE